jgi:hypothetical protein
MSIRAILRTGTAGLALAMLGLAPAQGMSDTINLQTSIGSFKMIDGKGLTSFSFEGTVLLIDVKGTVRTEGNLKLEFDDPRMKRKAYYGKGRITVEGSWRGIQWFGSNLLGYVKGESKIRLTGEFDRNLSTGSYWYGNKVNEKFPWYTSGITVVVPEDPRLSPKPTRRGGYGG